MSQKTKSFKWGAGVANDTDSKHMYGITITASPYKKIPMEFINASTDLAWNRLNHSVQRKVMQEGLNLSFHTAGYKPAKYEVQYELNKSNHIHAHLTLLCTNQQCIVIADTLISMFGYPPKPNDTSLTVHVIKLKTVTDEVNWVNYMRKEVTYLCPNDTEESCHIPISAFLKAQ